MDELTDCQLKFILYCEQERNKMQQEKAEEEQNQAQMQQNLSQF